SHAPGRVPLTCLPRTVLPSPSFIPFNTPEPLALISSSTLPPPISTLFPSTTLFRSPAAVAAAGPAERRLRRSSASINALPLPLRSEEHTSELQSRENLVCRLLLEKKKQ